MPWGHGSHTRATRAHLVAGSWRDTLIAYRILGVRSRADRRARLRQPAQSGPEERATTVALYARPLSI